MDLFSDFINYLDKLRFHFSIRSIFSSLIYGILWLLGGINDAIIGLFILMILDFFFGFILAIKEHKVCSLKLRSGAIKFLVYFIIIITANLVDKAISTIHWFKVFDLVEMKNLAVLYLCVTEAISILENMIKLGIPIPKKIIKRMKEFN